MTDWKISLESAKRRRACHGWILYAAGDRGLNLHYVDLYRRACEKRGMPLELGIIYKCSQQWFETDLCWQRETDMQQLTDTICREKPVFVVNRTRDYHLAQRLEEMGVCVFNHSKLTELGNDKAKAYRYMEQLGIPVMPTNYNIDIEPQWYPAVIKSCGGHGGSEVYMIRDSAQFQEWLKHSCHAGQNYVIQQAASDLGKDVRVYVVGNKITACVLRVSAVDFRSNYCLGGNVKLYELSTEERGLVMRTISGLSIGMAGIDFVFHDGRMVFNEIEDVAGARGLYTLTDYDIVDDYVGYIWKSVRHFQSL